MNEDQDVLRMQAALRGLDSAYEAIKDLDLGISLTMPDGSVNYTAVLRVLRDDEFAGFREQNPDAFRSIQSNFGVRVASSGLQAFNDLSKLGFALTQIKKANNTSDAMPGKIRKPGEDPALNQEISRIQQDIEQGLSRSERSLQESEDDRVFNSQIQSAQEYSGGQAAAAQAASRAAGAQRAERTLRRASLSEQSRAQSRARLASLLSLRQQQIDRGLRVDQYNNQQDMQKFRIVNQGKQDLMRAGYTNAFRAGDALFQDMDDAIGMFRDQMPGFVSRSNLVSDDGPLSNVFNSPLRAMSTGASLFGSNEDLVREMQQQMVSENMANVAASPFTGYTPPPDDFTAGVASDMSYNAAAPFLNGGF